MVNKLDLPLIQKFLQALRPNGPWTLTAIYKKDDGPPELPVVYTSDLAEIRAFCQVHEGTNLYYQANETKAIWKKASGNDLLSVGWVHVDIDHDEIGKRITSPEQKAAMLARLLAAHPNPTYQPGRPDVVVDSGNGLQALWRFEARPATAENIELLGRANRWILATFGGDKGTWNPAQLLRLPGTTNYPDKKKRAMGITQSKPAKVLHLESGPPIGLGHFELAEASPEMIFKNGKSIQRVEGNIDELQIDYNLPRWLTNIVKFGENPGEEHERSWSRSEWLFKGVCALIRHGVPNEYIKGILLDPDYGIAESVLDDKQQRSADNYAERQIWRAHEAVHNEGVRELLESPLDPAHLVGEEDEAAPDDGLLPGGEEDEQCSENAPKKAPPPPKYKLWTGSELAAMPTPTWIIEDMLPKESVGQLYGPTKEYKTFVALDMALCVATGLPFHGKLVARARVVYVAGEGQYDIYPRFKAWCIEHGIHETELDDWFRVCQDAVAVDEIEDSGELRRFARSIHAVKEFMPVGLIVFDTVNKNMKGDEKDGHAMSRFVKGCELVKKAFKATVLIIHHSGWNRSRVRGSSVLLSAVDASFRCAKVAKKEDRARLTAEHIRAARGGWSMHFQSVAIQISEATGAKTLVMRLVENQKKPASTTLDRVLNLIASSEIEAEDKKELAPKLTVRGLTEMLNKDASGCKTVTVGAVHGARVALRAELLLDEADRLTPKGMEQALEWQKIQTAFDEEEQSEMDDEVYAD